MDTAEGILFVQRLIIPEKLELIDIGKPETLARAEEFLRENIVS